MDEGSALNDMHKRADMQYEDQKKKEALAMRYWEEKKIEEQEKFSDEENDLMGSKYRTKDEHRRSPRFRKGNAASGDDSHSSSNGIEAVKVWQDKFHEVDRHLKDSMLSNAQLYNEKTALVYQVESLKDRLEDTTQDLSDIKAELQRVQSQMLHQKHEGEVIEVEVENLKKQIVFRDEFLERCGLHLPTGEDDEEQQLPKQASVDSEEKERLLKEIQSLKDEIASMKSSSILGDHQPKDIVQVSTKLVSEYKTKLQISEAENSRLDALASRLQSQVTRYKNQVKELEEREDELMKEKRHQAKEIRSLQSESEDQKTEIDLMKRRIEQLKKRRDYTTDS